MKRGPADWWKVPREKKSNFDPPTYQQKLAEMRARGGQWTAYRNEVPTTSMYSHLQFLPYGKGCIHAKPPLLYPVSNLEYGKRWAYRLYGTVDLETGDVVPMRRECTAPAAIALTLSSGARLTFRPSRATIMPKVDGTGAEMVLWLASQERPERIDLAGTGWLVEMEADV